MTSERRVERAGGARRPHVAQVAPDPAGRGGMAAVVRALLESSLTERYELTAIVTHQAGSRRARVRVSLTGLGGLAVWCLRHPHGVVHIHSAVRGSIYRKALAVVVARSLRHPVLFQLHAGPGDIGDFAASLGATRRRLLGAALRRAQVVMSVSDAGAAALQAAFSLGEVVVVPNAAPAPPADVPPPAAGAPVLFLGGFEDPAKGGSELLTALPAALAADAGLRAVLAGPGEPPPELGALPAERVEWRGWLDRDAKRRALTEAAIVVLPSVSEGLPIVLLEAMGYGRAIVATRVGGIPEIVTDDVDGLLVASQDAPALAAALAALGHDPARVRRLGDAARERVASLGERDVVARIDALYRQLLGEPLSVRRPA